MNAGEFYKRSRPVKASGNTKHGERILENHPSLKKPPHIYSEMPSSLTREPKFNGIRSNLKSAEARAESELSDARLIVEDLTSRIEQSKSRSKTQREYLDKLKRTRKGDGDWRRNVDNHQYLQVIRELEDAKQELRKLKQEMASLLEEKRRAEQETEASNVLKEEIEETNEERVLVELAQIEALKEYEAIENQRKEAAEKHSAAMEESTKKMNDKNLHTSENKENVKELERKLAITTSDIAMLDSELKQLKEMDAIIRGKETIMRFESNSQDGNVSNTPYLLKSITKELEEARKELASVREEGFKFMASMDIIRTELKNVKEEAARLKKREEKTSFTVQNLNAKLLRRKAKLEAASAAEEKAKEIVSNLSRALEQLKTETEAAKKERSLIHEETVNIKAEIEKTESETGLAEERLQAAIEELKAVKSSEATALEKLKMLIDSTIRRRLSASHQTSVITISNFEYNYLRGRAAGAQEIADRKVAAAQAWIEALKASEREILIKTEIAKKNIRELKIEEEQESNKTEQSPHAKREIESEVENWRQKYEKIRGPEKPRAQAALPGKSINRSGRMTPARRAKLLKAASPAPRSTPRSTPFAVKRRRKVMPNLAKLFRGKSPNK